MRNAIFETGLSLEFILNVTVSVQVGSGSTTNGRGGEAGGGGEKRGWLSSLLPFGRTPKSPPEREHSFGTSTKASVADKVSKFSNFMRNLIEAALKE